MTYFIAFMIFVIIFDAYLLFRNNWVYRQRVDWNNKIYKYRSALIREGSFDELNRYEYQQFTDSINSYNGMLFHYRWDLKYFVNNQKLYNLVLSNHEIEHTA